MWSNERPELGAVVSAVVAVARENGISLTAAGLAYYMFNTLVPLLIFAIIGLSVYDQLETLVAGIEPFIGVSAGELSTTVKSLIGDGAGRRRAAAIAGIILAWSSLTMVQSINTAFGVVYEVRTRRSLVETVTNTFVVFLTVVMAICLLLLVGVSLVVVTDDVVVTLLSFPLMFLALLGAFLPMYYRFPGEAVSLREALPGAAFSAVAWVACAVGFRIYVATSESVRLYGVVGGVLLLLTWLYLGGLTLLLGAILNAVLAGHVEENEEWSPTT